MATIPDWVDPNLIEDTIDNILETAEDIEQARNMWRQARDDMDKIECGICDKLVFYYETEPLEKYVSQNQTTRIDVCQQCYKNVKYHNTQYMAYTYDVL